MFFLFVTKPNQHNSTNIKSFKANGARRETINPRKVL